MEAAGLFLIKEYIQRHQADISVQMVCRKICELCTGAKLMPGSIWLMRWWDQDGGMKNNNME